MPNQLPLSRARVWHMSSANNPPVVRDGRRPFRQLAGQTRGTAVPRSDRAGPSTQPGVRKGPTTKFTAPAYYKFESIFLQRRESTNFPT